MLTFTDLVSLLLTFFVLMFSMSQLEIERWRAIAASLSASLDMPAAGQAPKEPARFAIGAASPRPGLDLDYLAAVVKQNLAGNLLAAGIDVRRDGDRLLISVPADLAFAPGSAQLSARSEPMLAAIASVLRTIANDIATEGHADPSPLTASAFASNWELSLARAEAVASVLRTLEGREATAARGFADSRYADLPVDDPERRRAMARRVDIVVLPGRGSS
ncbi:MAG: flagellar motor protein MotB [Rhodospirillales bacterium]|jgi:chemotaxis protein MotB|nr:flagellar motor protein MotB [Rhodospirillales bacterium]